MEKPILDANYGTTVVTLRVHEQDSNSDSNVCFICEQSGNNNPDLTFFHCGVCEAVKRVLCASCLLKSFHNEGHPFVNAGCMREKLQAGQLKEGMDDTDSIHENNECEKVIPVVEIYPEKGLVVVHACPNMDAAAEGISAALSDLIHHNDIFERADFEPIGVNISSQKDHLVLGIAVENSSRRIQDFSLAAISTLRCLDSYDHRSEKPSLCEVYVVCVPKSGHMIHSYDFIVGFGENLDELTAADFDIVFPCSSNRIRTAFDGASTENHDGLICAACEKEIVMPRFDCHDCNVSYCFSCVLNDAAQKACNPLQNQHLLYRMSAKTGRAFPPGSFRGIMLENSMPSPEIVSLENNFPVFPLLAKSMKEDVDLLQKFRDKSAAFDSYWTEWMAWCREMDIENSDLKAVCEAKDKEKAFASIFGGGMELGVILHQLYVALYEKKLDSLARMLTKAFHGTNYEIDTASLWKNKESDQTEKALEVFTEHLSKIAGPQENAIVEMLANWISSVRGSDNCPGWLPRPLLWGSDYFLRPVAWFLLAHFCPSSCHFSEKGPGMTLVEDSSSFEAAFAPASEILKTNECMFYQQCTRIGIDEWLNSSNQILRLFVSHAWITDQHPDPNSTDWRELQSWLEQMIVSAVRLTLLLLKTGCKAVDILDAEVILESSDNLNPITATLMEKSGKIIASKDSTERHAGFTIPRPNGGKDSCSLINAVKAIALDAMKECEGEVSEISVFVSKRIMVWIDYVSLPQHIDSLGLSRTPAEDLNFRKTLSELGRLQRTMHTVTLNTSERNSQRAWCFAEMLNTWEDYSATHFRHEIDYTAQDWEWQLRKCFRTMIGFSETGPLSCEEVIRSLNLNITNGSDSEIVCHILWDCLMSWINSNSSAWWDSETQVWSPFEGPFERVTNYVSELSKKNGNNFLMMQFDEWCQWREKFDPNDSFDSCKDLWILDTPSGNGCGSILFYLGKLLERLWTDRDFNLKVHFTVQPDHVNSDQGSRESTIQVWLVGGTITIPGAETLYNIPNVISLSPIDNSSSEGNSPVLVYCCDECETRIDGWRHHCNTCEDLDLCSLCYRTGSEPYDHSREHNMEMIWCEGPAEGSSADAENIDAESNSERRERFVQFISQYNSVQDDIWEAVWNCPVSLAVENALTHIANSDECISAVLPPEEFAELIYGQAVFLTSFAGPSLHAWLGMLYGLWSWSPFGGEGDRNQLLMSIYYIFVDEDANEAPKNPECVLGLLSFVMHAGMGFRDRVYPKTWPRCSKHLNLISGLRIATMEQWPTWKEIHDEANENAKEWREEHVFSVFVSHRWKTADDPDPSHSQAQCVRRRIRALVTSTVAYASLLRSSIENPPWDELFQENDGCIRGEMCSCSFAGELLVPSERYYGPRLSVVRAFGSDARHCGEFAAYLSDCGFLADIVGQMDRLTDSNWTANSLLSASGARWSSLLDKNDSFQKAFGALGVFYDFSSVSREFEVSTAEAMQELDQCAMASLPTFIVSKDFKIRGWCALEAICMCLASRRGSELSLVYGNPEFPLNSDASWPIRWELFHLGREILSRVACSDIWGENESNCRSETLFTEMGLQCTQGSDVKAVSQKLWSILHEDTMNEEIYEPEWAQPVCLLHRAYSMCNTTVKNLILPGADTDEYETAHPLFRVVYEVFCVSISAWCQDHLPKSLVVVSLYLPMNGRVDFRTRIFESPVWDSTPLGKMLGFSEWRKRAGELLEEIIPIVIRHYEGSDGAVSEWEETHAALLKEAREKTNSLFQGYEDDEKNLLAVVTVHKWPKSVAGCECSNPFTIDQSEYKFDFEGWSSQEM